ncbi:chemotaxis protein CheW [Brevundimonas intermedia]|uniref:Chemotaxis protein CheW n=1 Tax=Brevundimonas intermedia TaxID=74315 RepID=A0ABQ5T7X1_9CAUL|nr:chemotaxis protein CheW [Brevundimonas intermedia]GLK48880.1 chemotaxis protein CheW [Brevundimonas intermedia]
MSGAAEGQYVAFGLGDEVFAAPVGLVREILTYQAPSRIPNGPDYLLGLTDVRGRGVPTADLRIRLGMAPVEPTLNTRILVLDIPLEDRVLSLGLVADRVFEVAAFSADQIEPSPDIGIKWRSDYISGVVRREDGFVVLMDLVRLLSTTEVARLDSVSREAAHAA